jgi:hypothetical protein
VRCVSYIKRLSELLYNGSFSSKTILEIIETVLNAVDTDSNIYYNASITRITDTGTYSPNYVYEEVEKIVDDFVKLQDDTEWGVDANGFLFALQDKTTVTANLYWGENNGIGEVKISKDSSKIEITEYQVYRKTASGVTTRAGAVPDGGTYPYLGFENIIGKKISKKITAPDGLSVANALQWAYAKLKAQTISEEIEIADIDINLYNLKPFDLIAVWGQPGIQKDEIITCETLTGWTGGVSLSSDSIEGTYSIAAAIDPTNEIFYDLGMIYTFLQAEKIYFYFKTDNAGEAVSISLASTIDGYSVGDYSEGDYSEDEEASTDPWQSGNTWNFTSSGANLWQLVEIKNIPEDIRYICFRGIDNVNIKIDKIGIYHYYSKRYETAVQECEYNLTGDNLSTYNVRCGSHDRKANDLLFEIEKRAKILETVTT